jgi:hypothetical protein
MNDVEDRPFRAAFDGEGGALARERSNGKISKTKCNKMLRGATIKSVRGFFGNVIKGMKPGF